MFMRIFKESETNTSWFHKKSSDINNTSNYLTISKESPRIPPTTEVELIALNYSIRVAT